MSQLSIEIFGASPAITVDIGTPGPAATVAVGTTTTLAPGSSATVANVGTSAAAVLNFGIPAGQTGATGPTGSAGAAATIAVGTVTTLSPGASATVTNVGTSAAAVFDIGIPQGAVGNTGATGATGATGPVGQGVAAGGTTGQLLAKASGTNYDTTWTTIVPGDRYVTTSTTSLSISNGAKTLTIGTGLAYTANQDVNISYSADPTNFHMHAQVDSYNSSTGVLVVDVQNHTGTGTYTAWTVNVGGLAPASVTTWGSITGTLSSQTDLQTALDAKAPLASPALTGTPTAPTASAGTSTTQLATTAFVTTADNLKANIASPTFTGVPAAPTASAGTNTTQLATTAFVTNGLSTKANTASPTFTGTVTIPAGASISGYALLASPTFTGVPAAPTASAGTNTTQIATTAFVTGGLSLKANLASPTFTGTVTIPAGASISGYLTTSTAASTYQTLSGMSSYLTTSAAASTYQPIGSYLTDAPSDGSQYARQNGAWAVVTGGGGGVAWGAITGTVTDQTDLVTYVTGLGYQTASDVSTYVTGLGYLTDAPSDGSLYGRLNGAWSVVAGGTAAADQLTAGVVATNPATGPTTAGDVLQYDGTNLIWAAGGGATAADQLTAGTVVTNPASGPAAANDVLTYNGSALVWSAPAAPAKTVNTYTSNFTLTSGDANQIVSVDNALTITVPEDATYSFPVGTVILICNYSGSGMSQTTFVPENAFMGIPQIISTTTNQSKKVINLVKVAADLWCLD